MKKFFRKIKDFLSYMKIVKKFVFNIEDEFDKENALKDMTTYNQLHRLSGQYHIEQLKKLLLDLGYIGRANSLKFNKDDEDVAWVDVYEVFGDDVTSVWVKEVWVEKKVHGYYVYVIFETYYDYREESEEEILDGIYASEVLEKVIWKHFYSETI